MDLEFTPEMENLKHTDDPGSPVPENSPPRKKVKVSNPLPKPVALTSLKSGELTFENFDALPIRARNLAEWNRLLLKHPDFWILKCRAWTEALTNAHNVCHVSRQPCYFYLSCESPSRFAGDKPVSFD